MSNEKASNLYIPDYRAWEYFYEKRAKKDQSVGFGFETEREALKHQQQDVVLSAERAKVCDQGKTEPKIISVVSPVEQTVQQAESVMKKSRSNVKTKCSSKKKSKAGRSKKVKKQKKGRGKKASSFSYRTLGDIFSKRKRH